MRLTGRPGGWGLLAVWVVGARAVLAPLQKSRLVRGAGRRGAGRRGAGRCHRPTLARSPVAAPAGRGPSLRLTHTTCSHLGALCPVSRCRLHEQTDVLGQLLGRLQGSAGARAQDQEPRQVSEASGLSQASAAARTAGRACSRIPRRQLPPRGLPADCQGPLATAQVRLHAHLRVAHGGAGEEEEPEQRGALGGRGNRTSRRLAGTRHLVLEAGLHSVVRAPQAAHSRLSCSELHRCI